MGPRWAGSGSEPWGPQPTPWPAAARGAWRLAAQNGKGELCAALTGIYVYVGAEPLEHCGLRVAPIQRPSTTGGRPHTPSAQ
jgi:hypothetical protein